MDVSLTRNNRCWPTRSNQSRKSGSCHYLGVGILIMGRRLDNVDCRRIARDWFPDIDSGDTGSAIEQMIVVEGLALRLCGVPYSGVILGGQLLAAAGVPSGLMADIAAGAKRYPVALTLDCSPSLVTASPVRWFGTLLEPMVQSRLMKAAGWCWSPSMGIR